MHALLHGCHLSRLCHHLLLLLANHDASLVRHLLHSLRVPLLRTQLPGLRTRHLLLDQLPFQFECLVIFAQAICGRTRNAGLLLLVELYKALLARLRAPLKAIELRTQLRRDHGRARRRLRHLRMHQLELHALVEILAVLRLFYIHQLMMPELLFLVHHHAGHSDEHFVVHRPLFLHQSFEDTLAKVDGFPRRTDGLAKVPRATFHGPHPARLNLHEGLNQLAHLLLDQTTFLCPLQLAGCLDARLQLFAQELQTQQFELGLPFLHLPGSARCVHTLRTCCG